MNTVRAANEKGAPRRRPGRLKAEDVRELEAQLLAAARDTFTTDGYGATSMTALARAAGISKTTLYAKFPTKAALFRAIIDQQLERAYGAVKDAAETAPMTLAGSLHNLASQTLRAALTPENQGINRLIDWEAPRFPELAEMAQARVRVAIEHMASYIRAFAITDDVPCRQPERAAEIFNFMVRGLYYNTCIGAHASDVEALQGAVEDIVAAFLASRSCW